MMPDSELCDEDLLLQMRAGDEEAFLSLYRRRQGAICRFAFHMTGSASTAEDITQEVFLALIRKDCGFDPLRGKLSGYLYGIARKLVLRHLDRSRPVTELDPEVHDRVHPGSAVAEDPMVDLIRREGIEHLRRAILGLPKRYREVVVLCDLEELDYVAAAAVLECPVGTVRSRLHRARALLLDRLQQRRDARPQVSELKPARILI